MNANDIRLYEHIKLLQRGVELFQQQNGESCESLANGFNGQKVRIGLLGATSAGKTTLIKRLLSEAAGKISSRPETACLVVHSFARAESLVLTFNDRVTFDDEQISREFNDFLKEFKIKDNYQAINNLEWKLRADERERTLDCSSDKILEFFEQVNKFGEVFSKIKWNHKQRNTDYNLTDLFDIYDLPGFGGKEEHDQAVSRVFDAAKFDVLVYLIDTGRGIPGADEMPYLQTVQEYLGKNPETIFYWAYEKEAQEPIVAGEKKSEIDQAIEAGGCLCLGDRSDGLLDLTGPEDGDCELLRSKLLVGILKPYFADEGKKFVKLSYPSEQGKNAELEKMMREVFEASDSWPLIHEALKEIDDFGEAEGTLCTRSDARKLLIARFLGQQFFDESAAAKDNSSGGETIATKFNGPLVKVSKGIFRKCTSLFVVKNCDAACVPDGDSSDREIARKNTLRRILSSLDKIVESISNVGGDVSRTKIREFRKSTYQYDTDIRTLLYDVQHYWTLSDPDGVSGFIKNPMTDNLRDNISREVKAIAEFAPEEE